MNPYALPGLQKIKGIVTIKDAQNYISMDFIAEVVCAYYNVPDVNLKSGVRIRETFVWPRHTFHFLAHKHSGHNPASIGEKTARERTTVIASIKEVQDAEKISRPGCIDPLWNHVQTAEKRMFDLIAELTKPKEDEA